jgi:hypothetical protein
MDGGYQSMGGSASAGYTSKAFNGAIRCLAPLCRSVFYEGELAVAE